MMAVPRLVITRTEFDADAIAKALRLNEPEVVAAFRDGRGAWPFSEQWGARLYEFVKHGNSNQAGSDGAVALEQLRDVKVSVEALSRNGVKFQQSKFVGSGRSTTKQDLISSLEACDRVIVVDITAFPEVRFVPVDGTKLLTAAHTGQLTTGGWTKPRFYAWLNASHAVSVLEVGPPSTP